MYFATAQSMRCECDLVRIMMSCFATSRSPVRKACTPRQVTWYLKWEIHGDWLLAVALKGIEQPVS